MDYIKETLDWVNRERTARGLGEPLEDLPLGRRANVYWCPIAIALNANVASRSIWFNDDDADTHDELPECVQQFILAFDDGRLPQYVRPAA